MTEAVRIATKMALLTFLISSMLAAGLSLTPSAILAPLRNLRLVLAAPFFCGRTNHLDSH
jgi:predicted Na+-dependent transporter